MILLYYNIIYYKPYFLTALLFVNHILMCSVLVNILLYYLILCSYNLTCILSRIVLKFSQYYDYTFTQSVFVGSVIKLNHTSSYYFLYVYQGYSVFSNSLFKF